MTGSVSLQSSHSDFKNRHTAYKPEEPLAKPTRELLYEGKSKNLYQTDRPEFIIQEFKNDKVESKRKGKYCPSS